MTDDFLQPCKSAVFLEEISSPKLASGFANFNIFYFLVTLNIHLSKYHYFYQNMYMVQKIFTPEQAANALVGVD